MQRFISLYVISQNILPPRPNRATMAIYKSRIVANLAALALISDAILVQEAHLNHLDTHSFQTILPDWSPFFSSKSNGRAGVVTLLSPHLSSLYAAEEQIVDPDTQGHVLGIRLTPLEAGAPSVTSKNTFSCKTGYNRL